MKTLRKFEHDGSEYEIQATLDDDIWKVRVLYNGSTMGEIATFSDDIVVYARRDNVDIIEHAADEMEKLVRSIYDFRVGKYR